MQFLAAVTVFLLAILSPALALPYGFNARFVTTCSTRTFPTLLPTIGAGVSFSGLPGTGTVIPPVAGTVLPIAGTGTAVISFFPGTGIHSIQTTITSTLVATMTGSANTPPAPSGTGGIYQYRRGYEYPYEW